MAAVPQNKQEVSVTFCPTQGEKKGFNAKFSKKMHRPCKVLAMEEKHRLKKF